MKETWKPTHVEGFFVSSLGQVKGSNGLLRTQISNRGYEKCTLSKNGKRYYCLVHRLVAKAFIENEKKEVNHKDGNKLNNHVSNLEWVTRSENELHRARVLKQGIGIKNGNSILKREDILEIRKLHKRGKSYKKISQTIKISKTQVARIVKGIHWSHV